jgi:glutamine amidotransferase
LNWIPGTVKRLPAESSDLPLPHMGWNSVAQRDNSDLFKDFPPSSEFYFLHSYYFEPAEEGSALARTQYGINFSSAIQRGKIFGAQFHPEKSHGAGIALLKNFAEL